MIPMTVVRQHLSFPRRIRIPGCCSSSRLRSFRQYRLLVTILVAARPWRFRSSSLPRFLFALAPAAIEISTLCLLPAAVKAPCLVPMLVGARCSCRMLAPVSERGRQLVAMVTRGRFHEGPDSIVVSRPPPSLVSVHPSDTLGIHKRNSIPENHGHDRPTISPTRETKQVVQTSIMKSINQ